MPDGGGGDLGPLCRGPGEGCEYHEQQKGSFSAAGVLSMQKLSNAYFSV